MTAILSPKEIWKVYEIDFISVQNEEFKGRHYKTDISSLLKRLETETNVYFLKNQFLAILQLFYDGLIDNVVSKLPCEKQKEILNDLILAGKKAVGSFYRGNGIEVHDLRHGVLKHESDLVYVCGEDPAKNRHLERRDFLVKSFGSEAQKVIAGNSLDVLVCVASGAFEPSLLAMDVAEIGSLIPLRYSQNSRSHSDNEVKVPACLAPSLYSQLGEKKVLVIEDVVATGRTLREVMKYVLGFKPKKLYGGSVEGNMSVRKLPDFLINSSSLLPNFVEARLINTDQTTIT